jgi:hypothetical protein
VVRKTRGTLFLCLVLLVLAVGPGQAQGPAHDETNVQDDAGAVLPGAAPWFIDLVHVTTSAGPHVSVAVDPNSGTTYVAYYIEATAELYLARYVGLGGNCGPGDSWWCSGVDHDGDVGMFNSIAVYPHEDPLQWRLGISYYDATNAALKFALYYTHNSRSTQIIDRGNPATGDSVGLHTSLRFDSNGVPHIAYERGQLLTDEELRYAYAVSDGSGNCGEDWGAGYWQCDVVDSGSGVGIYASLDLDGNDNPTIAYYDSVNDYPWVAVYDESSDTWTRRRVHQPTLDTGRYISLAVEDDGWMHIAYHNVTSGTLEYAEYVGTGGNCGLDISSMQYEWQCDEIDDMGTSARTMGVSMVLDGAGRPVIAYQDKSEVLFPAALKIARPASAVGIQGNCGPKFLGFFLWRCDIVDGGSLQRDEGESLSLALNSAGLATIAYHEFDQSGSFDEGNVKVAFQQLQVFMPLVPRKP